jgi:SH3-like domain-containing protein
MFVLRALLVSMFTTGLLWAVEMRATSEAATILFDSPSLKGQKQFVLARDIPLEVLVQIQGWVKVRDAAGTIAWVEQRNLGERRHLQIKNVYADILSAPDNQASVVFRAEQNVLLQLEGLSHPGWVKVRHRDGQSGFVRIEAVFGL